MERESVSDKRAEADESRLKKSSGGHFFQQEGRRRTDLQSEPQKKIRRKKNQDNFSGNFLFFNIF